MMDISEDLLDFSADSLELPNKIVINQEEEFSKDSLDTVELTNSLESSNSINFTNDSLSSSSESSFGNMSEGEWCLGNFKTFDDSDIPQWFQPMSSSSSVINLGEVVDNIGKVNTLSSTVISSSSVIDVVSVDNTGGQLRKSSSLLELLDDSLSLLSISFDSLNGISGK